MKLTITVVALSLVASGCASTLPPEVTAARSPASAYRAAPLPHQNPLADYTRRVAVEPKPWRGLNDAQAPGGKS